MFFLMWLAVLPACTEPAPWAGEGLEGNPCYPSLTCDPGLVCVNGRCQRDPTLLDLGPRETSPFDGWTDALVTADGPCNPPLDKPVLSKFSDTTVHNRVMFQGTAKGAATVIAALSGKVVASKAVVADAFCLEAAIDTTEKGAQVFHIIAINAKGCTSAPAVAKVTYTPSSASINLVTGKLGQAPIGTSGYPTYSGDLKVLTDGSTTAKVTFAIQDSDATCGNNYTYVEFDLGAVQTVEKVVLVFPKDSKRYVTCWDIHTSTKASPTPPQPPYTHATPTSPTYPDWTVAIAGMAGTKDAMTIAIPTSKAQARHVGLSMYENADNDSPYEYFDLSELEVWGQPAPPSCP